MKYWNFKVGEKIYYEDKMGRGCLQDDVAMLVEVLKKEPKEVLVCEGKPVMAMVEFDDRFIVTGYDGTAHVETFIFKKERKENGE